jgi:hypothetical protein
VGELANVDAPIYHLTNTFSKKLENQAAVVALYFMY